VSGHVLDNPIWHSLSSRHTHLGVQNGSAARFRPEISAMGAVEEPTPEAFEDLAKLVEPGSYVLLGGLDQLEHDLGPAWRLADGIPLAQMLCEAPLDPPDLETFAIGEGDVDDVMELVDITKPGPFERGTVEMGRYLGLRESERLVAMAGERMMPDGYIEVSAVCTHPDMQGRGLGEAFVRAVTAPIQQQGEIAFLHVHTGNARAIALYERLGFVTRREAVITPLIRLG
jgi:ribosomal protein S18 acetylase RimI-like enzyme